MEHEDVVEVRHLSPSASTTSATRTTSSCSCSRSRSCSSSRSPTKATWMRMLLCELNRIHSHLVFLGTSALELGRSRCSGTASASARRSSTSTRWSRGSACTPATSRSAGSPRTSRRASIRECRKFVEWMPHALDDYQALLDRNEIWLERTKGVGLLSAARRDRARADRPEPARVRRRLGSAPRPAVPRTTTRSTSSVPVYPEGDVYDRYRVRMDEMAESNKHRPPVPRQARAHGGQAVDRRRPQGRAAAARGAPHLDGVPHPPLQDRHRGLPRARGRDLRRDRVAARRVGLLPRLGRRPEAVARPLPRSVVRRARGDGDVPAPTRSSPT